MVRKDLLKRGKQASFRVFSAESFAREADAKQRKQQKALRRAESIRELDEFELAMMERRSARREALIRHKSSTSVPATAEQGESSDEDANDVDDE